MVSCAWCQKWRFKVGQLEVQIGVIKSY
jgi:hypothetical protein